MIGVYDSGLGGITALKPLCDLLPDEKIIYLGDTARVPYGTRSKETIKKYALQCTGFLKDKGVSALLVACGTVSANALEEMRAAFDFPITGVITPTAKRAVEVTKNGKIVVLATPATVKSRAFENEIKALDKDAEVVSRACPLFVPLIENGSKKELVELACREHLTDLKSFGADTVILGCTHFPIISDYIKEYFPKSEILCSGEIAANEFVKTVKRAHDGGGVEYFVTDGAESFAENADVFLSTVKTGLNGTVHLAKINV